VRCDVSLLGFFCVERGGGLGWIGGWLCVYVEGWE
jgi:hypothetical protein